MVPNPAPPPSATITEPLPPLTRSTTLPLYSYRPITTDRTLLAPEDAIYQGSPPRKQSPAVVKVVRDLHMTNGTNGTARVSGRTRHKDRPRSGSRRRKGTWKKLLWVNQSYPDNYTDQETFLEHLQRNPRLQPYDFWPLVADSTVIVQHVCSVIIFVVCFVGIFQERVSPVAIVGWGSIATFLGWLLWDWWVGQEESTKPSTTPISTSTPLDASASSSVSNLLNSNGNGHANGLSSKHSHSASASSLYSSTSNGHSTNGHSKPPTPPPNHPNHPSPNSSLLSHRTSLRLSTAKSALLIYFTLLGLSPILKSLTRSTSSDSIWTMSLLLFAINIFFFDYGSPPSRSSVGGGSKNIPASLSTNAALMASTVLASRLPSTGQVFSLTLFSIEVFGLFPVFRRYARQRSWRGHVTLTSLLVAGAGGGVGLILGHGGDGNGYFDWPWKSGLLGAIIGVLVTGLVMGGCSWWLIGLQKYKNEIHGPWDPARPVIRRDDY
ncbi:phosphatidylinositol N-acetylglucosaminyltransferase-domain-containing protein [Hyaloscypha finlandica]|nr:phosphatidylinositol N-acetylglucosaminyltransferase-domain-containing protein [Hyaloscypha finlandica]KAH8769645.1 phosphatidylinositol N-acetylglucosaminyltransferase-domain-containing protein [Hyaloscypha sp. PMI_1271]